MRALLLAAATLALTAGAAGACPGHAQRGGRVHGAGPLVNHAGYLADTLKLSEAQREALEKIATDLKAGVAADRKAMRDLHADLRALWMEAELPAREDVEALQRRMRAARDHMAQAALEARLAARRLLTAEQTKALVAHMADYAKTHRAHGADTAKGEGPACPHAR